MYLGIDPGLNVSAIVITDIYKPVKVELYDNDSLIDELTNAVITCGQEATMIIEVPICRKWSGSEISYTAIWTGRFIQAWPFWKTTKEISRSKVRGVLGCSRGGDQAVRDTLIERFDPDNFTKTKAGVYKDAGSEWFMGFKRDIWQAYATVVAHLDDTRGK